MSRLDIEDMDRPTVLHIPRSMVSVQQTNLLRVMAKYSKTMPFSLGGPYYIILSGASSQCLLNYYGCTITRLYVHMYVCRVLCTYCVFL